MSRSASIIFVTDFGEGSSYAAQLSGEVYGRLESPHIVHATHTLPPFNIAYAEVFLRRVAFSFPAGSVMVVVVDPGVGSTRRGIAISTRGRFFVGPDNGVLGALATQPDAEIVELRKTHLHRTPTSDTFHGRDVFTPIAVELACGLSLDDVGERVERVLPSTLRAIEF